MESCPLHWSKQILNQWTACEVLLSLLSLHATANLPEHNSPVDFSLWPVPAPSFMSCLPGFLSWAYHTLASYPNYRRGDYWLWEGSSPQANPPQILLFSEFLQHWEPPSHNPDDFPCDLFSLKMFQFNRKLNRNHIFYLFQGPQSTWMNCTQFNWMHKIWLYVSILIVKYVNMCVCSFIRSFIKLILDTTFAFSPQNYHENFLLCIDQSVF